jgi:hypothetical protein
MVRINICLLLPAFVASMHCMHNEGLQLLLDTVAYPVKAMHSLFGLAEAP